MAAAVGYNVTAAIRDVITIRPIRSPINVILIEYIRCDSIHIHIQGVFEDE